MPNKRMALITRLFVLKGVDIFNEYVGRSKGTHKLRYKAHRNSFASDDVVYVVNINIAPACKTNSGEPWGGPLGWRERSR
jgi:hypothetical protein